MQRFIDRDLKKWEECSFLISILSALLNTWRQQYTMRLSRPSLERRRWYRKQYTNFCARNSQRYFFIGGGVCQENCPVYFTQFWCLSKKL